MACPAYLAKEHRAEDQTCRRRGPSRNAAALHSGAAGDMSP